MEKPEDKVLWEVVYGNDSLKSGHEYSTAIGETSVVLGDAFVRIARRGEMKACVCEEACSINRSGGCPFYPGDDVKPMRYCDCRAGHVQREIHRRAEDEALRLNLAEGRLGKWVEESEHVHHYFEDVREADDDVGRVVLVGDAMVDRGHSKLFGGLWYGVTLSGEGVSETGNFVHLEDAKKWIEERVAARSKV